MCDLPLEAPHITLLSCMMPALEVMACLPRLADELSGWVQRHQRGRRKIPQRVQERQVGALVLVMEGEMKTGAKCPGDFRALWGPWRGGCEMAPASRDRLSLSLLPFPLQIFRYFSFQKSQLRRRSPPVKPVPTQPPGPAER